MSQPEPARRGSAPTTTMNPTAGQRPWPARLDDAFGALDRAGIRWALLRPIDALGQPLGDIDLLIDPRALDDVARLLTEQRFVPIPFGRPDLHAADYDPDSGRLLWLHVQIELRLGNAVVPADAVLAELDRDPLPRPAGAWLFWILLLHGLLDKGEIAERYRPTLQSLAALAGHGPTELTEIAEANGLVPSAVVEAVCAGDWDALSALVRRPAIPRQPFGRRVRRLSDHVGGLWKRRGISVAVIGPDGAGKTTLVNGLQSTLPFPTRVVYMGLTGGRLPKADRLRIPGIVFLARVSLLWTRYALSIYHRVRGRIVLFDRYVLDAAVPSGRELTRLGRFSRRVQGAAVPRPTLVILLDASGATMHGRKLEYDAAVLEDWRVAYRRLTDSVSSLKVIDAEQPAELVHREAQALVWAQYGKRWLPRSNEPEPASSNT